MSGAGFYTYETPRDYYHVLQPNEELILGDIRARMGDLTWQNPELLLSAISKQHYGPQNEKCPELQIESLDEQDISIIDQFSSTFRQFFIEVFLSKHSRDIQLSIQELANSFLSFLLVIFEQQADVNQDFVRAQMIAAITKSSENIHNYLYNSTAGAYNRKLVASKLFHIFNCLINSSRYLNTNLGSKFCKNYTGNNTVFAIHETLSGIIGPFLPPENILNIITGDEPSHDDVDSLFTLAKYTIPRLASTTAHNFIQKKSGRVESQKAGDYESVHIIEEIVCKYAF